MSALLGDTNSNGKLDPGESGCLAGGGEGDQLSDSVTNISHDPVLFLRDLRRRLGKKKLRRQPGADLRRLIPPNNEEHT